MTLVVALYCGENPDNQNEEHILAAHVLGTELAKRGVTIVYGGTKQGLMGVAANAALAAGGNVIGVVTKAIPEERRHKGLTELHVVEDLDARKILMTKLSQSSLVLPGGHGTFDELERELTLVKFGRKNGEDNQRDIIIYDPNNFFDPYIKLVKNMGKIKGSKNDSSLFSLVKGDVRECLLKLGVMGQEEYNKIFERNYADYSGFLGLLSNKNAAVIHNKPMAEKERSKLAMLSAAFYTASFSILGIRQIILSCLEASEKISPNATNGIHLAFALSAVMCIIVGASYNNRREGRPFIPIRKLNA